MNKSTKLISSIIMMTLFLAIQSFSQVTSEDSLKQTRNRKWQINFGIADFLAKSAPTNLEDFITSYMVGHNFVKGVLGAKYLTPFGSVRTSFSMGTFTRNRDQEVAHYDKNYYSERVFDFSLGFERYISLKKFNVYYGLDVIAGLQSVKQESVDGITDYYADGDIFYIGGAPLIGIDYSFNRLLSVSTEMKVRYKHYSGNYSRDEQDHITPENSQKTEYKYSGSSFDIGPVGFISFNIHL